MGMSIRGQLMAEDGISVIIPAYNVGAFIAEAFASIAAQTRRVHEIIAVDDGSTDDTASWLEDMARKDSRLRVLSSGRLGPSGARNLGLEAATQPMIAFLDADDVWPGWKIELQMDRLRAADRPDVVSGLVQRFAHGASVDSGEPANATAHVNLGACLFHRRVFDVIGHFDQSLDYCEDVDLMFRIREAGLNLVIMPNVTLYYRTRPGSLTQDGTPEDQKRRSTLKALRLSIDRRRAAGLADLPSFAGLIDE